ncbi:putative Esterase precursor [Hibiscus syriacus]|uniref:Esterase n=2 Tax=Hibiscus syriacus TaxID=106335 RepID=A0A6A3CVP4_HIBSY|nr:putative Esterase precursor [Hibiscus syriacus]
MNGSREDNSRCYFHPKEVFMGICALCLNERLLILASKQAQRSSSSSTRGIRRFIQGVSLKKPPINLPKIFALGSLLNRLEFKHCKSEHSDASTSQEDSFISIKFEENGVGSWEKGTVSKVSLEQCNLSWNPTLTKGMEPVTKETNKSVIEHEKPRASIRWRKRIGHLFQLVRWKRSSKAKGCHMGGSKIDGVKVMRRKGWMRTLTK